MSETIPVFEGVFMSSIEIKQAYADIESDYRYLEDILNAARTFQEINS